MLHVRTIHFIVEIFNENIQIFDKLNSIYVQRSLPYESSVEH